ncbi:DUF6984 family protein [Aquimarina agarivorans]|uniref:DUF6984 family protein n=1 Tax=Aquimarina agarivorans TaxID=980584 RepID=UPI000248EAD7|nr:hypothetical protein [Aquimarina agarivorans]
MRPLKSVELELLKRLTNGQFEIPRIVRDLNDGGMGSISFDLKNCQARKRQIISAEYIDKNGVLVDIELTCDNNEKLFELDFWKVDFSPLIIYPTYKNLKINESKHS